MNKVYEVWCVIKVYEVRKMVYEVRTQKCDARSM